MKKNKWPYQWVKYFPMSRPCAGKATKSEIFLFATALNRFKCKHSTSGSFENVCCFMVTVFSLHETQNTGSESVSGRVKWSRQMSTLIFPCREIFLVSEWDDRNSLANGKDTFENDSDWVLLQPHCRHMRTDLRVPVNIFLMKSEKKCEISYARVQSGPIFNLNKEFTCVWFGVLVFFMRSKFMHNLSHFFSTLLVCKGVMCQAINKRIEEFLCVMLGVTSNIFHPSISPAFC